MHSSGHPEAPVSFHPDTPVSRQIWVTWPLIPQHGTSSEHPRRATSRRTGCLCKTKGTRRMRVLSLCEVAARDRSSLSTCSVRTGSAVMNLTSHLWDRTWNTWQSPRGECGTMASLVNRESASPAEEQTCSFSGTRRSTQYMRAFTVMGVGNLGRHTT